MKEDRELVPKEKDMFEIMDRWDDELILKELSGQEIDIYVYQIPNKETGGTITQLSKAGVDAVAREMALQGEVIREESCEVHREPDAYEFTAKASRYLVNSSGGDVLLDSRLGFKRQLKKLEVYKKSGKGVAFDRSGNPVKEMVDNPFFFEQGGIKATRNATKRLIRKDLEKDLIDKFLSSGKVKRLDMEQATVPPAPSAATLASPPGERKASQQQINYLYGILKKKGTLKSETLTEDMEGFKTWCQKRYGNPPSEVSSWQMSEDISGLVHTQAWLDNRDRILEQSGGETDELREWLKNNFNVVDISKLSEWQMNKATQLIGQTPPKEDLIPEIPPEEYSIDG